MCDATRCCERDTTWAVARENAQVIRTPMAPTAHPHRRLEERLGLRFPRLLEFFARAVWRMPTGSRARRALIRRFLRIAWEAMNRGDLEACFMLYHPDCESTFPPELATIGIEPGTHRRDERIRLQQKYIDEWVHFRFEPEELIEVGGDRLVSIGRMKATGHGSGVPVDTEWVAIFTTLDGRVIRERVFADHGKALEAAGLSD